MKPSHANIRRLSNLITRRLTKIPPEILGHRPLTYDRMVQAYQILAQLVHDFEDDSAGGCALWYDESMELESVIIAGYWHFTEWHRGQASEEYKALSLIGEVYQPGFSTSGNDFEGNDSAESMFHELAELARTSR